LSWPIVVPWLTVTVPEIGVPEYIGPPSTGVGQPASLPSEPPLLLPLPPLPASSPGVDASASPEDPLAASPSVLDDPDEDPDVEPEAASAPGSGEVPEVLEPEDDPDAEPDEDAPEVISPLDPSPPAGWEVVPHPAAIAPAQAPTVATHRLVRNFERIETLREAAKWPRLTR
jgi:hypothetical protein